MGQPKDSDVDKADTVRVQSPAGRVEIDSRGNSVWRWAKDIVDSTSILLKRLENKDLALEPTQKVPVMRGGKADKGAGAPAAKRAELAVADRKERVGGGFDPYNSRPR